MKSDYMEIGGHNAKAMVSGITTKWPTKRVIFPKLTVTTSYAMSNITSGQLDIFA